MKNYFQLFANCIITKGAKRGIIADLQNYKYTFIPISFANILIELKKKPIASFCKSNSNISNLDLIKELNKLVEQNFGHYTDYPNSFPELDKKFLSPHKIQDCILELSEENLSYSGKIINGLAILGCQALELRSYNTFDFKLIGVLLQKLSVTRVRSVEIFIKHQKNNSHKFYEDFLTKYPIITLMVVHNCKNDKLLLHNNEKLQFSKEELNSNKCCGNISKDNFMVNIRFYLESIKFNNCLNRKISIDKLGNIKNCPSLQKNFGNIRDITLQEVLELVLFKELWEVNKDKISTCKNCEFRYICSDCRAYVDQPYNAYSKPLKCGYNPETATWENWRESPLKQKAIKYYEL